MYWLCYTTAQILGKLKCVADPINRCSIKRASIFKYCKNGQTTECLFLHIYVASQVHIQDESKSWSGFPKAVLKGWHPVYFGSIPGSMHLDK